MIRNREFHVDYLARAQQYEVMVSMAEIGDFTKSAYAVIVFDDEPASQWELAVLPRDDISRLKPGEVFGYGVDYGTGCFCDTGSAELLSGETQTQDQMARALEETDDYCTLFSLNRMANQNIALFSTSGDGICASYFGLNAAGQPVCLLTDFGVFTYVRMLFVWSR